MRAPPRNEPSGVATAGTSAAVTAKRFAARRRIWLVADDYGISPAVSAAIRDLVVRGRLNATSVMVAAPTFDRSEALPLTMLNIAATRVAIGLHVTLTGPFRPLSSGFRPTRRGAFPSLGAMMARAFLGRLDRKAILLHYLSRRFRARAEALGLRTNPAFAGTYDFAARTPFAELFPDFLEDLPDGAVIMCHPGQVDDELTRLDSLTRQREDEYAYLGSDAFAALLRTQGVALA